MPSVGPVLSGVEGLPDAELTRALDDLILKMAAKDKAERFQSASEWVAALAPWIASYPMDEPAEGQATLGRVAQEFFGKIEFAQRKVAALLEKEGIHPSEVDTETPSSVAKAMEDRSPVAPAQPVAAVYDRRSEGTSRLPDSLPPTPRGGMRPTTADKPTRKPAVWAWATGLLMVLLTLAGWYFGVHLPAEKARLARVAEFEKEKQKKETEAKGATSIPEKARLETEARKADEEAARLRTEKEKSKQAQLEAEKKALTVALEAAFGFKKDGDWANVVASLEKPLKAPGAADHPNREAAEALLSQAQAEIKKRAEVADAKVESSRSPLAAAPTAAPTKNSDVGAVANREGGREEGIRDVGNQGADNAGKEQAVKLDTETVQTTKEINAYDPKEPSHRIGMFKAQSALEIEEFVAAAKMYRVKFKAPDGTEIHALCRPDDLGKEDQSVKSPQKGKPWKNSLGMKFVPVAGTEVLFAIWDTRVQDYAEYLKAEGKEVGTLAGPTHPVVNVSWEDAKAFCKWLTEKEGQEGWLVKGQEYRLPSDKEWSRAVGLGAETGATPAGRSGQVAGYPWGKAWPPPKGAGNYAVSLNVDEFDQTSPVGSFKANKFGLYDMGGNVWQWCEDLFNPQLSEDKRRVFPHLEGKQVRGASWESRETTYIASSYRNATYPGRRLSDIGFRCVVVIVASP